MRTNVVMCYVNRTVKLCLRCVSFEHCMFFGCYCAYVYSKVKAFGFTVRKHITIKYIFEQHRSMLN
jgi:hypothetical protein